jgi:hypothetical protein
MITQLVGPSKKHELSRIEPPAFAINRPKVRAADNSLPPGEPLVCLPSPHFSPAFYCGGGSGHVYFVALGQAPRRTVKAPSGRAPCIHARLHRLATKSGEKSGLATHAQPLPTFGATPAQNQPATLGRHPGPESMGFFSPAVIWLERPLHDRCVSGRWFSKAFILQTITPESKRFRVRFMGQPHAPDSMVF